MKPRFSPSCDPSRVKMVDRFESMSLFIKNKLGDRMIKHLLNSVIAKYRRFSGRRSVVCLRVRLRQISHRSPLSLILSSTEWSETNAAQKRLVP